MFFALETDAVQGSAQPIVVCALGQPGKDLSKTEFRIVEVPQFLKFAFFSGFQHNDALFDNAEAGVVPVCALFEMPPPRGGTALLFRLQEASFETIIRLNQGRSSRAVACSPSPNSSPNSIMKKIIVCTDGSHYSQEACRYAAFLAEKTGAAIEVLYVTDLRQFEIPAVADLSGSLGVQPFEGMIAQLQEVEAIKADFVEEQSMAVFDDAGLGEATTFRHETGLLVDLVHDLEPGETDLILLGKRGENADFASEHLGSMLERVVRAAQVPCLVSNRQFHPIEEMTLAYDGGPSCRKALDYLIAHKAMFESVKIHVVTCVEGRDEDQASDRLEEAERKLASADMVPVCEMLSGVVEQAIADYVRDSSSQLLVLGAYGHSRIRELLIGSTTTELLRSCHVPVLCFR